MEYIEGPDLDTVWQQQPEQTFSWAEVKTIMSPIIMTPRPPFTSEIGGEETGA